MQFMGHQYVGPLRASRSALTLLKIRSGYLASCRSIVSCAKQIEAAISSEIPELYVLGKPPASVVAFASCSPASLSVLEVGDAMGTRGWHLNGLSDPPAVHIACTVSSHVP
jgi:sphinganine-1-phosphate aldolase